MCEIVDGFINRVFISINTWTSRHDSLICGVRVMILNSIAQLSPIRATAVDQYYAAREMKYIDKLK